MGGTRPVTSRLSESFRSVCLASILAVSAFLPVFWQDAAISAGVPDDLPGVRGNAAGSLGTAAEIPAVDAGTRDIDSQAGEFTSPSRATDAGMSEDLGGSAPESARAKADEMKALEGEFSSRNPDFKSDFTDSSVARDAAMIEDEMEINLDEIDEISPSEGEGVFSVDKDELAILDREQIGIRTRDRLEKLQTPEELNRLRTMERLKPLSLVEIESADRLKPVVPLRGQLNPALPGSASGTPLPGTMGYYPGYYQSGQGFSRLETETDRVNVRSDTRPATPAQDLVRMENSGRMVLEERKEREEFKKRQERRTTTSQSASGSSTLPYLPNQVPAIK